MGQFLRRATRHVTDRGETSRLCRGIQFGESGEASARTFDGGARPPAQQLRASGAERGEMPECEHCGASFEAEGEYLEHLGEDHWGELGRIDRRRVETHRGGGGGPSRLALALGGLAIFVVGVLVFVTVFQGGGDVTRTEAASLPDSGDAAILENVSNEPDQGRQHVAPGTEIDSQYMPPSGGPHHPPPHWTDAGFYEEPQPLGELVHSLEHGAVVVWYDPDEVTPEASESLRAWARTHQDDFGSVIAVPNPVDDPEAPYVLTAWERRLTMEEYDVVVVRNFAGEYLGRGPENQIR